MPPCRVSARPPAFPQGPRVDYARSRTTEARIITSSLKRTLLLAALAGSAGLAGLVAGHWAIYGGSRGEPMQATVLPEARPLPAFELTDAQGSTFSRASLEGGWSLWFFGFTNCPDVCPMTLNVLAHARRQLADLAPPPTVVFVSLDPQRDEPAVIAEYIAYFDSEFVGVTGEPAALDALASRLGVAYGTTPTGSSSYTIDHTSALFLVNTRAELVAVFTPPHDARRISHDLRLLIAGDAERG